MFSYVNFDNFIVTFQTVTVVFVFKNFSFLLIVCYFYLKRLTISLIWTRVWHLHLSRNDSILTQKHKRICLCALFTLIISGTGLSQFVNVQIEFRTERLFALLSHATLTYLSLCLISCPSSIFSLFFFSLTSIRSRRRPFVKKAEEKMESQKVRKKMKWASE